MDVRKNLDGKAVVTMLVLCLAWGAQQVAVKAVAEDIPPILQISWRSGIAAFFVALVALAQRNSVSFLKDTLKPGLLIGLLFALEFIFLSEGLKYTTASHVSVFLYTAPAFAALGLHWKLPTERLQGVQWFGMALAFLGVVAAFLGADPHTNTVSSPNMLLGDFYSVLGGMAWGATTIVIRTSRLSNAPATQTLLYQLLGAFVILLLGALFSGQTHFVLSPRALASLFFQSVLVSFVSYLIWFILLRRYLASRLGVLSFLTPFFGIAFGVILLDEPLEPSFVIGAILVFIGILLVTAHGWLRQFYFKT